MECRICKFSEFSVKLTVKEMMFGTNKEYDYLQCRNCGTLQIENIVADDKLLYPSEYYSFNYNNKVPLIDKIKKFVFARIVQHDLGESNLVGKFFSRLRPSLESRGVKGMIHKDHHILDVGCGQGALVEALASLGFKHAEGIDPFINKDIDSRNFKIHKKFLFELEKFEPFDVVMLHHSFEHMSDPDETLKTIYKLLKPDGKCIIRIPVCDSFAFEKYKENWVQMDAPRHVFLHTNKSIQLLTDRNRFKIVSVIDDSVEFQFIGSELYKKSIPLNAPNSYYQPLYKKWLGIDKPPFTKNEIANFRLQSQELNKKGIGDQRIFVLNKK